MKVLTYQKIVIIIEPTCKTHFHIEIKIVSSLYLRKLNCHEMHCVDWCLSKTLDNWGITVKVVQYVYLCSVGVLVLVGGPSLVPFS